MKVFILTYCRNLETFYGTGLIFKTLRVGFPNCRICVTDNASLPDAQARIEAICRENECDFHILGRPGMEHHEFIHNTLRTHALGPSPHETIIFLDPDICLWQSWEEFSFHGLLAGKLSGKFQDPVTDTITMPRIHSSFLWINDPGALWKEILRIRAKRFDFLPFHPFSFRMDGTWYRYDTGANILAALPGRCSFFDERHFDRYDHIYAGSHLDWILDYYNDGCREMLTRTHHDARTGNLNALKGIWRDQNKYLNDFPPKVASKKERSIPDEDKTGKGKTETEVRSA